MFWVWTGVLLVSLRAAGGVLVTINGGCPSWMECKVTANPVTGDPIYVPTWRFYPLGSR